MAQISFNEMAEKKADFEVFLRVERKMKENTISAYLRDIDNFFCFCRKRPCARRANRVQYKPGARLCRRAPKQSLDERRSL